MDKTDKQTIRDALDWLEIFNGRSPTLDGKAPKDLRKTILALEQLLSRYEAEGNE